MYTAQQVIFPKANGQLFRRQS